MKAKAGKPKAVRVKSRARPAPKTVRAHPKPAKPKKTDSIDALIVSGAEALGLPIDPAWRRAVKFNLQLLLNHAARVDAFALPDDAEPAPVFHA
jgi:hypothetical protein